MYGVEYAGHGNTKDDSREGEYVACDSPILCDGGVEMARETGFGRYASPPCSGVEYGGLVVDHEAGLEERFGTRRGVEVDGGGGSEVCLTSGIVFDYEFIGEPSCAGRGSLPKNLEQKVEGIKERRASVIF